MTELLDLPIREARQQFEKRYLLENLQAQGDTLAKMPLVFQYNKQDLPNLAPNQYMDFLLNNGSSKVPTINAAAIDGTGVLETLNAIAKLVIQDFVAKKNAG